MIDTVNVMIEIWTWFQNMLFRDRTWKIPIVIQHTHLHLHVYYSVIHMPVSNLDAPCSLVRQSGFCNTSGQWFNSCLKISMVRLEKQLTTNLEMMLV